ncbi:MAG: glycosyl hydrolase family 18 protein [Firmicutes bacterium]|nr:glycosyl hydrolase family 18 protein [Bacillota bacterium]
MQCNPCQPPYCPEMAAYWQTFHPSWQQPLALEDTPCDVTDVIIAFAVPDEEGALHFAGPNHPTRRAVCRLRERGQNVLLSVGGGGVTVSLDTPERIARFAESLYSMITTLCVNGIDIDVEQGIPASGTPLQPEGPLNGLIEALDSVLAFLPQSFLLTMAPEVANLVGGITAYNGVWGNYLPLLLHYGNRVSRVHMQYYNTGPMQGIDGQTYAPGTVPFIVAMTDAVVQGFPIADTGVVYPGLPSWKVSIGLPAAPQAAYNGFLIPEQIDEALRWLRTGYRGGDTPNMPPYRYLGGLMTWSLQWDALNDFAFIRHGARVLCIRQPCEPRFMRPEGKENHSLLDDTPQ